MFEIQVAAGLRSRMACATANATESGVRVWSVKPHHALAVVAGWFVTYHLPTSVAMGISIPPMAFMVWAM